MVDLEECWGPFQSASEKSLACSFTPVPVRVASDKTLVADVAFKDGGLPWGDIQGDPDEVLWAGSPAHGTKGNGANRTPIGGNHVFADSSGRWVDFSEMRELHSWSGARNWYYFQKDLGDQIPPLP